jgi:hypothetical protein
LKTSYFLPNFAQLLLDKNAFFFVGKAKKLDSLPKVDFFEIGGKRKSAFWKCRDRQNLSQYVEGKTVERGGKREKKNCF